MKHFIHNGIKYEVDRQGYLLDPAKWDDNFAEGMASKVRLPDGLTDEHWKVIRFIRNSFDKINICPLIYVACKENNIGLGDMNRLFPTGYHRGACKLAGISYRQGYFHKYRVEGNLPSIESEYKLKVYRIDSQGFLVDPTEWDENFAVNKAFEMKMPGLLTKKHWQILVYLREKFIKTKEIPTLFQTCEMNNLEMLEFDELFPDGYHRGAVKLAGLRLE